MFYLWELDFNLHGVNNIINQETGIDAETLENFIDNLTYGFQKNGIRILSMIPFRRTGYVEITTTDIDEHGKAIGDRCIADYDNENRYRDRPRSWRRWVIYPVGEIINNFKKEEQLQKFHEETVLRGLWYEGDDRWLYAVEQIGIGFGEYGINIGITLEDVRNAVKCGVINYEIGNGWADSY